MHKLLLLAVGLSAICTAAADDLPSRWVAGVKTAPDTFVDVFLSVDLRGDSVSGTIAYEDEAKQSPIENVALRGNKLSFEAHDNANRVVAFNLTVENQSLTGQITSGGKISKVTFWPPPPPGVYRARSGGVTVPKLVHKAEPSYSREAQRRRIEGTVLLYVQIDPSGRAINIRVLHSLGFGLNEKAIEAVRKWRFKPGTKDGKPVTVEAQIEVNFRLV